jgi:excisionase family DNA binding protein
VNIAASYCHPTGKDRRNGLNSVEKRPITKVPAGFAARKLGDFGEFMAGSVRKKISPTGSSGVQGNGTRANQRRAVLTLSPRTSLATQNRGAWEAREVMDIRQAADYLGISSDSLYKYASESLIPAFKLGNRWRFKRSLLDHWMELQSSSGLEVAGEKSVKPRQKKPVSRAH